MEENKKRIKCDYIFHPMTQRISIIITWSIGKKYGGLCSLKPAKFCQILLCYKLFYSCQTFLKWCELINKVSSKRIIFFWDKIKTTKWPSWRSIRDKIDRCYAEFNWRRSILSRIERLDGYILSYLLSQWVDFLNVKEFYRHFILDSRSLRAQSDRLRDQFYPIKTRKSTQWDNNLQNYITAYLRSEISLLSAIKTLTLKTSFVQTFSRHPTYMWRYMWRLISPKNVCRKITKAISLSIQFLIW